MVSRKVVFVACGLAAACALGVSRFSHSGVIPSSLFLRSAEEMKALREVLDDEVAWPQLVSLSERLSLWRVATASQDLSQGEACFPPATGDGAGGEPAQETFFARVLHTFEFASPAGVSSRVYRVEYVSCRDEQGNYEVRYSQAGFQSDFQADREPLLQGPVPLQILRLAFKDPGVAGDIVNALQQQSIADCRVAYEAPGAAAGHALYRFVAAGGDASSEVLLEYLVDYDEELDTAVFSRR